MTSRNGLLDEQGDAGEFFQKLDFDIPPWVGAASEHWWASNDDSPGVFVLGHCLHEFAQVLADPGIFVGRTDETLTLICENSGSAVDCRVY